MRNKEQAEKLIKAVQQELKPKKNVGVAVYGRPKSRRKSQKTP